MGMPFYSASEINCCSRAAVVASWYARSAGNGAGAGGSRLHSLAAAAGELAGAATSDSSDDDARAAMDRSTDPVADPGRGGQTTRTATILTSIHALRLIGGRSTLGEGEVRLAAGPQSRRRGSVHARPPQPRLGRRAGIGRAAG
jgi:hypothetical protein